MHQQVALAEDNPQMACCGVAIQHVAHEDGFMSWISSRMNYSKVKLLSSSSRESGDNMANHTYKLSPMLSMTMTLTAPSSSCDKGDGPSIHHCLELPNELPVGQTKMRAARRSLAKPVDKAACTAKCSRAVPPHRHSSQCCLMWTVDPLIVILSSLHVISHFSSY